MSDGVAGADAIRVPAHPAWHRSRDAVRDSLTWAER